MTCIVTGYGGVLCGGLAEVISWRTPEEPAVLFFSLVSALCASCGLLTLASYAWQIR